MGDAGDRTRPLARVALARTRTLHFALHDGGVQLDPAIAAEDRAAAGIEQARILHDSYGRLHGIDTCLVLVLKNLVTNTERPSQHLLEVVPSEALGTHLFLGKDAGATVDDQHGFRGFGRWFFWRRRRLIGGLSTKEAGQKAAADDESHGI